MNTFFYNIFLSLRLPGPSFLFPFLLHKSLHLFAFIPGWFLFSCRYGFDFLFMSSFLFLPAHYFGGGVCPFFLFSSCKFLFSLISSHRAGIFFRTFFPHLPLSKLVIPSSPLFLWQARGVYFVVFRFRCSLFLTFLSSFFFPLKNIIKDWLGLGMWILTN